jgi:hypothetical protein
MKKPLAQLGVWNRLHDSTAKDNIPTPTASLAHPEAINCAPALIAAFAICGVLGGISLLVPPFIHWDTAIGFLAWRGTLLGAVNSIIEPDRSNIARDTVGFLTTYSPGQYLVPGAISLSGVPVGIAMTLTVALALLASLIGWIRVVQAFAPRTSLALLVTVLIASFHYSTRAFTTYHGGEILLQAATPWLILTGCRVPEIDAVPAALLAAGAVFFAFMAKLTGLIVAAAALVAGCMVILAFGRRITRGMIGGAFGAVAALAVVYVTFLSAPSSHSIAPLLSKTHWSLPFRNIAFCFLVPWVTGISWADPLSVHIFHSNRFSYVPTAFFLLVLPPAVLVAGLVLFWRPQTTSEKKLKLFSLWFFAIVAAVFSVIYIHGSASAGGPMAAEDRYFRSAGTLLFLCALISAFAAGTPAWISRGSFLVLCALMALYGVASFSYFELRTAEGQSLDRASWTNQWMFDAAAIDFAREIYAREGRDALFVLPLFGMAQSALTLPVDARILVMNFDFEPETAFVGRYFGRVPGHVVVLVPNIFDTSKRRVLLSAFRDYAPDAWNRKTFANTSVYFQ